MRRFHAVLYFCAAALLVLSTNLAAPSCSKQPSAKHTLARSDGVSYGAILAGDPEQVDRLLDEEDSGK
jgi:hypothetical protein